MRTAAGGAGRPELEGGHGRAAGRSDDEVSELLQRLDRVRDTAAALGMMTAAARANELRFLVNQLVR